MIVLASTNASAPVLDGAWLTPGAHITSIVNSDQRFPRRELDNETFARASLVVIGYVEQTKQDHAADILEAIQAGVLNWRRICQLGEILTGARTGRTGPEDITVFKNNGLAGQSLRNRARAGPRRGDSRTLFFRSQISRQIVNFRAGKNCS